MRRWYTDIDSGTTIRGQWHSLLVALIFWWAEQGIDPYELARNVVPVTRKDDDRQAKNFQYKHQLLVVLLDVNNLRIRGPPHR